MRNNIIGFFLLVIALTIGFGLVLPKIHELHDLTVQQKALDQLGKKKQMRKEALQALTTTFATQQDKIKSVIAALPPDPQVADVLITAEAMGKEANITFTSITPLVSPTDQKVTLVVQGQAPLQNIEALMNAISQNNRPMSVVSTTLTKVDNNLGFNINLSMPYAAPQTAPVVPLSTGTTPVTVPGTSTTATQGGL